MGGFRHEGLRGGVWHGVIPAGAGAPGRLVLVHLGEPVAEAALSALPDGGWQVTAPLPLDRLTDGATTFHLVPADEAGVPAPGAQPLASLPLLAGAVLDADLRAELDLLRAELDMLKREFRRQAAADRSQTATAFAAADEARQLMAEVRGDLQAQRAMTDQTRAVAAEAHATASDARDKAWWAEQRAAEAQQKAAKAEAQAREAAGRLDSLPGDSDAGRRADEARSLAEQVRGTAEDALRLAGEAAHLAREGSAADLRRQLTEVQATTREALTTAEAAWAMMIESAMGAAAGTVPADDPPPARHLRTLDGGIPVREGLAERSEYAATAPADDDDSGNDDHEPRH